MKTSFEFDQARNERYIDNCRSNKLTIHFCLYLRTIICLKNQLTPLLQVVPIVLGRKLRIYVSLSWYFLWWETTLRVNINVTIRSGQESWKYFFRIAKISNFSFLFCQTLPPRCWKIWLTKIGNFSHDLPAKFTFKPLEFADSISKWAAGSRNITENCLLKMIIAQHSSEHVFLSFQEIFLSRTLVVLIHPAGTEQSFRVWCKDWEVHQELGAWYVDYLKKKKSFRTDKCRYPCQSFECHCIFAVRDCIRNILSQL